MYQDFKRKSFTDHDGTIQTNGHTNLILLNKRKTKWKTVIVHETSGYPTNYPRYKIIKFALQNKTAKQLPQINFLLSEQSYSLSVC